jgi:iron complex transport system permease protein
VNTWNLSRLLIACLSSILFWLAVAAVCMMVGHHSWSWPRDLAIRDERFAAVMVASLVGAALASAGVAYQAVLRNPLAEPYLLGVSSGASLLSYVAAICTGTLAAWLEPLGQQSASFIGAMAALTIVLLLSQRRGRLEPVTLLLVGVIVSSICGAIYLFIYHLNLRREVSFGTGGPFRFLVGAINTNLTTWQITSAAILISAGWGVLLYISGQLNVALLSEAEAESLGVDIQRLRWIALGVASLITASAVAVSGPIGFVGLICPHIARLIIGSDVRKMLPLATSLGAVLLVVADAVSRALASRTGGPLPVGVLTGLLGGPFFLVLLWRGTIRSTDRAA